MERVRGAYGLTGLPLVAQARSGLELYVLTAELLARVLRNADRPIIEHTLRLIRRSE